MRRALLISLSLLGLAACGGAPTEARRAPRTETAGSLRPAQFLLDAGIPPAPSYLDAGIAPFDPYAYDAGISQPPTLGRDAGIF